MTSGASCRVPGSARLAKPSGDGAEPLARQFIAAGIDDLAKYRIVRLLYQYQSLAADAASYASYAAGQEIKDKLEKYCLKLIGYKHDQ